MSEVAWSTTYSVETKAPVSFAWSYMTAVKNWDDPPAQFKLNGPFAAGTRGSTETPGQPTRNWELRNVKPNESYIVEIALDRATMSFEWQFHPLHGGGTRLTQQLALQGENAAMYLPDTKAAFESNLAPGMSRVAAAIDRAYEDRD